LNASQVVASSTQTASVQQLKKKTMLFRSLYLLIIALLAACAAQPVRYDGVSSEFLAPTRIAAMPAETQRSIAALAQAVQRMSPAISAADAQLLAHEAHIYPMHLANVWRISDSPLLHNLMTNNGEREFGLCIDWAYAMRERLRGLGLRGLDWHWGIANEGSPLREHSTLVVTAQGAPFGSGIVLDPWRHSGRLFWSAVGADDRYEWQAYSVPEGWTPQSGMKRAQ
jgi:hypothetical protein